MNFTYLVEKGDYSKEDLTSEQKAYIGGMEDVMENTLEGFAGFVEHETASGIEAIDNIVSDVQKKTIETLKEYIYSDICERIVCFGDENAVKEEQE